MKVCGSYGRVHAHRKYSSGIEDWFIKKPGIYQCCMLLWKVQSPILWTSLASMNVTKWSLWCHVNQSPGSSKDKFPETNHSESRSGVGNIYSKEKIFQQLNYFTAASLHEIYNPVCNFYNKSQKELDMIPNCTVHNSLLLAKIPTNIISCTNINY